VSQHILVYTSPAIGGVLQYNHSIVCALAASGYEVTYVQDVPEDLIQALGPTGMSNLRQRADVFVAEQKQYGIQSHVWLEPGTPENAQEIFAKYQPDLVLFSNGAPIANVLPKRLAVAQKIPFVVVENLVHPNQPPAIWEQVIQEMATHYIVAKAVIAVSQDNLSLLRKFFSLPADKGQVIHNGRPQEYFDPPNPQVRDRLRQEFEIPADAVICFTAARLDIIKGYQYQIGAIKRLRESLAWSKLYFAWAGNGTLETQLKQTVKQLGIDDRVKFLGDLPNIVNWLNASDIFVLPSEAEGMPLSIMEAMAKGLPVVATAVSGIPEELGQTGKLLPSPLFDPQTTIQELADTIATWATDEALRRMIGQACKQRAETMFREERFIQETLTIIHSALNS
jgi:glycosyltransferase involved in cell wall biosynthesis